MCSPTHPSKSNNKKHKQERFLCLYFVFQKPTSKSVVVADLCNHLELICNYRTECKNIPCLRDSLQLFTSVYNMCMWLEIEVTKKWNYKMFIPRFTHSARYKIIEKYGSSYLILIFYSRGLLFWHSASYILWLTCLCFPCEMPLAGCESWINSWAWW